jgi:hypothetical protein
MVYLPMCYLYCRRFNADAANDPLLSAIRQEIYTKPYDQVGTSKAILPTGLHTGSRNMAVVTPPPFPRESPDMNITTLSPHRLLRPEQVTPCAATQDSSTPGLPAPQVDWDGERHSVSPLDEYDPVTKLMEFLQVRTVMQTFTLMRTPGPAYI